MSWQAGCYPPDIHMAVGCWHPCPTPVLIPPRPLYFGTSIVYLALSLYLVDIAKRATYICLHNTTVGIWTNISL